MQRYNTVSLMNTQESIVKPAFDCIYNKIYGE
jgi:chromosome partitioning protein